MSETKTMNDVTLNGQKLIIAPEYSNIRKKPTLNGVTIEGDKTLEDYGIAAAQKVTTIEEKVNKLPKGIYYGQYDSVENLLDSLDPSQLTDIGYAYVASEDPTVYYIYNFNGEGSTWKDSGNKFVTTALETDLETKSTTKAPTTEAVKEGIEAVDITKARTQSTELTAVAKYNAAANINDRVAKIDSGTSAVVALGYKVLDTRKSFVSQVTAANTIYEIKDKFDLNGGSVTIPANCTLKFEGGTLVNGTIVGDKTVVVSPPVKVFSDDCSLSGTWVGEGFAEWFSDDFEKCINVFKNIRLLPGKTYELSSTLKMPSEASITGNGSSTIHTDGTFDVVWVGFKCTINGVIFKTDTPCNTIVVCFEQIAATRRVDTQTTSLNYKGIDAHILIENVIIQSKGSANNAEVYAIKVISDGAKYSNISGFWGVTIRKVSIGGDYYYGVTFDNGTCVNSVYENPWLTSCLVEDVTMANVRNCFFIGQNNKGSSSTAIVGFIVFRRCQAQRNWNIGYKQQAFFEIEKATDIFIEEGNPQDWLKTNSEVDENNDGEAGEYRVNRNNCRHIVLTTSVGTVLLKGSGTNNPVAIHSTNSYYPTFSEYTKLLTKDTWTPSNGNYFTVGELRGLQDGNYGVLYNMYPYMGLTGAVTGSWFLFKKFSMILEGGVSVSLIIGRFTTNAAYASSTMATMTITQEVDRNSSLEPYWCYTVLNQLKKVVYTTSERPNKTTMSSNSLGMQIYDSTLGKPIFWGGYAWKSADGNFVYDQEGSTTQRPLSSFNNKQYKEQVDNDTVRYLVCIDMFFYNAENGEILIDATGNLNDLATNYSYENNKGMQVQLTDTDPFLNNRILKIVEPTSTQNCQWYDKDLKAKLRVPDPVITFDDTNNTATITCDCESATIYYYKSPDGATNTYTGPINLEEGDQLSTVGRRSNMLSSFYNRIKVVAPVITIDGESNLATITTETEGATIYYTVDGSDPTTESSVYQTSIEITTGTTIKAVAIKIGRYNSDITTKTY